VATLPAPQVDVATILAPQVEVATLPAPQVKVATLPAPQVEVATLPAPQVNMATLPAPQVDEAHPLESDLHRRGTVADPTSIIGEPCWSPYPILTVSPRKSQGSGPLKASPTLTNAPRGPPL
jgi:hypothetical protein